MTGAGSVECAVVGLGVLGAASLLALARAGVSCVGLEAGRVGHPDGGSGGETRIFRTAVATGPDHVRLLDRSRELWTGVPGAPFTACGALTVGTRDDARVRAVALPGRTTVFGAAAAAARWPAHVLGADEVAVLDPGGGLLDAGAATRGLVAQARRAGAGVREEVTVLGIGTRRGRAVLHTVDGETVADSVVVATGHGDGLVPGVAGIEQRRVVLSWFGVRDPALFAPAAFPPGVHTAAPAHTFFPTVDGATIKINHQQPQPRVHSPADHHPPVEAGYTRDWADAVAARLDGMSARPARLETYVEGYTRQRRGVVALTAGAPRTVTLGGFSGQGFKYAPAVGELVADLVRTGRSRSPAFAPALAVGG
ncbi:FAD-dependent oxidoreductase [Pseudonocardia sp. ICBG1293]|uniref:FAD-dependent oxidoreductase n=1 Tax=Pseudonocardia sp. ICBG1293 TaxID=2844382 RepID=UPI001CCBEACC|nr:FAD-dependent oxidoreductase [Pseudonocardia sp. ICBG1293]